MGSLRKSENRNSQGLSALTGWLPYWYGSGTMALAVAVKAACANVKSGNPKVVLAAYGCPDLVAAIQFAGATPYYVDLEIDRLNMDPAQLIRAFGENDDICAVIGTELFGVAEKWEILKESCPESRPLLIQDCAQSMQSRPAICDDLHGDMVVFSFGRGKPVCLLGGGALLVSDTVPDEIFEPIIRVNHACLESRNNSTSLQLACYNVLLSPRLYAVLAMLMGDRLGETRFKPLVGVERSSNIAVEQTNTAIEYFWSRHTDNFGALVAALSPILHEFSEKISSLLPSRNLEDANRTYLRMPLLACTAAIRDTLIGELVAHGIGATAMYKRILPDIVMPKDDSAGLNNFPAARDLADRLLTLPVHGRLTDQDINLISNVLRNNLV